MKIELTHRIVKETDHLLKMMRESMSYQLQEGGIDDIFSSLQDKLSKIYLRPNNVIDAGSYSRNKIEDTLSDLGYEFRKEMEGKFHYFNKETSISLYLNPLNRKITLTP